jgi:hypothetical protein
MRGGELIAILSLRANKVNNKNNNIIWRKFFFLHKHTSRSRNKTLLNAKELFPG